MVLNPRANYRTVFLVKISAKVKGLILHMQLFESLLFHTYYVIKHIYLHFSTVCLYLVLIHARK